MGATFSCEEQEAVVGRLVNAALAPHKAELLAVKRELKATRAELDLVRGGGGGGAPRETADPTAGISPRVTAILNRLARQRSERSAKAASEAPAVVVEEAEAENVTPITYGEAFEAIGGASELRRYAAVSARLAAAVGDADLDGELRKLLPRDYADRKGFSTRLVNQHFIKTLEELYEQANVVHEKFDDVVRALAAETGGRAVVPPVKGEVRARMKALFKYADEGASGDRDVAWYRLTDLVRATIEYPDLEALYGGLERVVAHFGTDAIKELNDRYQEPMAGGYRDLQLTVYFAEHVCELQLSTEAMNRAKMTTGHRDFEVVRELKAAVAKGDLERVVSALEFGREHLGHASDGASALRTLLRGKGASTLLHQAARAGHADILHAFLLHGADANARDPACKNETVLHAAVFAGNERCVWVLLDASDAVDLDAENDDGQTALVAGYLMLWQRPPEAAVRALSTLAQVCGVARIRAARAVKDEHLRRLLKPSRLLVDYAASGNVEKLVRELKAYTDPDSRDNLGTSALEAATVNCQAEALERLLDYNATVPRDLLTKLDRVKMRDHPGILESLAEAGLSTIKCVEDASWTAGQGPWSRGLVPTETLGEGAQYRDNPTVARLKSVPTTLSGVVTHAQRAAGAGVFVEVDSRGDRVGVLIFHADARRAEYERGTRALEAALTELGFARTTYHTLTSDAFGPDEAGADIWSLPVAGRKVLKFSVESDMELCVLLFSELLRTSVVAEVTKGNKDWAAGPLPTVELVEGVKHFSDREYCFENVPELLSGRAMTQNPCHCFAGLEIKISAYDEDIGVLIDNCWINPPEGGHWAGEYVKNARALVKLLGDLGFTGPTLFEKMTSPSLDVPGVNLYRRPIRGKGSVTIRLEGDMEIQIVALPLSGKACGRRVVRAARFRRNDRA